MKTNVAPARAAFSMKCIEGWRIRASGAFASPDAAAYVKPYMKRHKNDAVDAEAIGEAVTRANMLASSPGSASP